MSSDPSQLTLGTSQNFNRSQPITDLIWQNTLSGQIGLQRTSSGGASSPIGTIGSNADLNWRVMATGDVNRDGKTDLLMRHGGGSVAWWGIDATGQTQAIATWGWVPDQNWQVISSGDANADGNVDLLWRNRATGQNSWWIMGAYQAGVNYPAIQAYLAIPTVDLSWNAIGTGDVNRDGVSDILWFNKTYSAIGWWTMDSQGTPTFGNGYFPPTGFEPRDIVDFNGDGQLDFVFQDQQGKAQIQLGNPLSPRGTFDTLAAPIAMTNSSPGSGWKIVGTANMDAGNSLATATLTPSGIFTRTETIGGSDLNDVYQFGLGGRGIFSASLSGLSADADLKLILDKNNNGQLDAGDEIVSQWERGTKSESVRRLLEPGGYYLQVSSYDAKPTNYTVQTGFQDLKPNEADPEKFRIQINYGSGVDRLTAAVQAVIRQAADFWETVIPYRSSIVPSGILPITITSEDLNLRDGNPDLLTLAYAGPQVVSNNGRLQIQSGTTTINARRLDGLASSNLKDLLIHEFSHALGFGTLWDPLDFRGNDGGIVKIGTRSDNASWIDRTNQTYRADSYVGWAYGELLKPGQAVPTATPLESQYLAHWSEEVFQSESLTPLAPSSGSAPVSLLTLAALRDLGWNVNYGAAQAYTLPTTRAAASGIDFSNLSFNVANAARSVDQLPQHSLICGCAHHLAGSRPASLGPTKLMDAIAV
jgi:hypothetical protein